MKKNIIALLGAVLISSSCVYAQCDRVEGVCRLNDLNKISQVETPKTALHFSDKDLQPIKLNQQKPGIKEFIKSLLKPSK